MQGGIPGGGGSTSQPVRTGTSPNSPILIFFKIVISFQDFLEKKIKIIFQDFGNIIVNVDVDVELSIGAHKSVMLV